MMQITDTLFAGVAVIAASFELTTPAIVLGAVAYWLLGHAA
jgi:hypothetical protein